MGLDQYIYKSKVFNNKNKCEVAKNECEIAYFRKVNPLHGWILRKTETDPKSNCEYIELNKELLIELSKTLDRIMIKKAEEGIEKAINLGWCIYPTMNGFCFGSTEYDSNYFDDIKYTKNAIDKIISEWDDDCKYYYYSWW